MAIQQAIRNGISQPLPSTDYMRDQTVLINVCTEVASQLNLCKPQPVQDVRDKCFISPNLFAVSISLTSCFITYCLHNCN